MKELVLMRHGKAVSEHAGGDFRRPLTTRGEQQAQQAAAHFRARGWQPDGILTSPATRALQTARITATAFPDAPLIQEPALYLASSTVICEALTQLPGTVMRILLVGHNPGLSDLAMTLGLQHPAFLLPTGGWAAFTLMIDTWQGCTPDCTTAPLFAPNT